MELNPGLFNTQKGENELEIEDDLDSASNNLVGGRVEHDVTLKIAIDLTWATTVTLLVLRSLSDRPTVKLSQCT